MTNIFVDKNWGQLKSDTSLFEFGQVPILIHNEKILSQEESSALEDMAIESADYLLNKGIERETAFRIMEDVRKGKCIQEKDKEKLREHKVSFDFIKYCDSQPYLASRGQVIAIMNLMLYTSIGITFFYLD